MAVRFDTLFSIRYAVRALERQANVWSKLSSLLKFASVLSGTAALMAITSDEGTMATVIGLVFAALQAIEVSTNPGDFAAQCKSVRRDYAALYAREKTLSDADLDVAYHAIVASDDIGISDTLAEIAYNDVFKEFGCTGNEEFTLAGWQKFIKAIG